MKRWLVARRVCKRRKATGLLLVSSRNTTELFWPTEKSALQYLADSSWDYRNHMGALGGGLYLSFSDDLLGSNVVAEAVQFITFTVLVCPRVFSAFISSDTCCTNDY